MFIAHSGGVVKCHNHQQCPGPGSGYRLLVPTLLATDVWGNQVRLCYRGVADPMEYYVVTPPRKLSIT